MAVISGKNLSMDEQKPKYIFSFRRLSVAYEADRFELYKGAQIRDRPES